ncbi:MAG TPA: transglycosylase SLT domain-containing protein [Gemmatimonadales bacterium]|nr:transglycosylase SLT domain-containing protein [Gemmatimonadales bacterium]
MHFSTGSSATRLGGLTLVGLLAMLPHSGTPGAAAAEIAAVDSVVIPLAPARLSPPTLLDSLRAETALPAAAVRPPLERYLGRYSDDRLLVRRISRAVLRESRRQQVPPSLITAVLLTENTTLRPEAESSVGAQGLMQVMPFHAGARLCNSDDLVDVDSNICHGTLILARNLRATSTSAAALLRYNGCVRGTNTPDCRRYPGRVLARASRVRRELLAGANGMALVSGDSAAPVQLAGR